MGFWSSTATDGPGLELGEPITLTWSYVPDGMTIHGFAGEPVAGSNLRQWLGTLYPGGFPEWHAHFVSVFERWGALTGVRYVYEPNDDGATFLMAPGVLGVRGDVRIGAHFIDGYFGILGYNTSAETGGDMVLDSFDGFFDVKTSNSLRLRNVLAHEHGHGLGLRHVCPANGSKLMEPYATDVFDGPQLHEILTANRYYGDSRESNDDPTEASYVGAGQLLQHVSVDSSIDWDWYRLDTQPGDEWTFSASPEGQAYLMAPPNGWCDSGEIFDPTNRRDLALSLFNSNGTTLVASSDQTGAGSGETLTYQVVQPGPLWLRVSADTVDEAQLYSVSFERSSSNMFGSGFEPGDLSEWSLVRNLREP